ncbi:MAG: pyridoxal-phosphate dependent enzyme [Chitinophagaceae bacterium]|nr:pyridoxal-phosphate dependent enzyme [Chitinophagaceae bacterium]
MISKVDIEQAHNRIIPFIHHTPVLTCAAIDELVGASVFFKCENFQKVGAFKSRGAMNAALSLSRDQLSKGLATHSSGNHAQALARAAKILGTPAHIVMPRTAPEIKKKGVAGYGATIYECEPTLAARETTLADVVSKTGATEIHPFDNNEVITGQATAAKELFEEVPNLDCILTPVGGGGLLSGTALAAHYFSPSTTVIAGEPSGADDAFRSMQSGKIEASQSKTIADGLLTSLSPRTFAIISQFVKEVKTVTDEEIIAAMRLVWERMKIIVEPSGVVPLAALIKNKNEFSGKRIGIILTGGNVDLEKVGVLFQSV